MQLLLISATANKIMTAFSWMLIHSLWQGLLLSVIAGAVLMLNKKWGAARRYNVMLVLFAALIGMCGYTFIVELNHALSKTIGAALPANIGANVSSLFLSNAYDIKQLAKTFASYFSANAPLVVMVWFVFFLFKSVKMMACLVYNHKVKTLQLVEPDQFWAEAVAKFSEKLQISKTVRLVQSGYIKMPVVIGHLKPVVLIPLGLMASLPADQVEAILLHELAHIRRNDYLVNFLQNIAETVFFFNPGLLWISSLLREERENCCDDIALSQTKNKKGFVQALISFKEYEMYGSSYATAFPGKKNFLMRRVSRIIGNENKIFGLGEKIFFTSGLLILGIMVTTAAIAQLKGNTKLIVKNSLVHNLEATAVVYEAIAEKQAVTVRRLGAKVKRKMRNGIHVITHEQPIFAKANIIPPLAPVAAANVEAVSIRAQVVSARGDAHDVNVDLQQRAEQQRQQTMREKEEAKKDEAQALADQAQARKDQEQAVKDQAQARLDQAQALIDQKQALKDQAQAKIDQQQAVRQQEAAKQKEKENKSTTSVN